MDYDEAVSRGENNGISENQLLALFEDNNKDERDALMNYYVLLEAMFNTRFKSDEARELVENFVPQIREIISDEMNHSQKLSEICILLSGIKPAED